MKDHLDQAIDMVAARMTAVEEERDLALRIAHALPQRSLSTGWVTRFAFGALATVAIIVTLTKVQKGVQTTVQKTVQKTVQEKVQKKVLSSAVPNHRLNVRMNDLLNDRRSDLMNDRLNDHEFSLAPLAVVEPLEDEALTLAPLEIPDLQLTSDFPVNGDLK